MSIQRLSNAGQSGYRYKNLIAGITPVPSVPTIGAATALTYSTASVEFTAPGAYAGSTYTATSSPGGLTGTSASSPITVSGLSENTAYTFTVTATNATGTSGASAASSSITTPIAWNPEGAYDSLATVTVGSTAVSSVTFGSIPSGYKHLQLRWIGLTDDTASSGLGNVRCSLFFNGDTTATNYYNHDLKGSGTSASSGIENSAKFAGNAVRNSQSGPGTNIVNIFDFASTDKRKVVRTLTGFQNNDTSESNQGIRLVSGLWNNSSAISSIQLVPESGNLKLYTNIALYGVK